MSLDALAIAWVIVMVYVFYACVRIVREDRRLVVFRLGQCIGARGPGVVYLLPFMDRAVSVDLRESLMELRSLTCSVQDNEAITLDLFPRWRIVDPMKAVLEVADVASAIRRVATATACGIFEGMALGDALTRRDAIARDLREALAKAAESWGVVVTGVEIRDMRRVVASPSP